MKDRIALRPFRKGDWDGYAGASPFLFGADPLIGCVLIGGEDADVLVDRDSIEVEIAYDQQDSGTWIVAYRLDFSSEVETQHDAQVLAKYLLPPGLNWTIEDLTKRGFKFQGRIL